MSEEGSDSERIEMEETTPLQDAGDTREENLLTPPQADGGDTGKENLQPPPQPDGGNTREKLNHSDSDSDSEDHHQRWKPEDFKKRECITFIEDSSRDGRCQCGCPRDRHPTDIKTAEATEWTTEQHSSERPTDAVGLLKFEGEKRSSYFLRLSSDTEPSLVYDLMTRKGCGGWYTTPPYLLVSVVGGDGSAEVKPWVQKVIKEGLVKVSAEKATPFSSYPWILSDGFDEGIGRFVGVAERRANFWAVGIAPWGFVHNKDKLVNPEGSTYSNPAGYSVENKTSESCCLEKNHRYFLLVDDGREGHSGGEKNFRAKFEEHIPRHLIKDTSITIPVLCVLVSGDLSILERVSASLENKTPWLVLAGSGAMAELLSDISKMESPEEFGKVGMKHLPHSTEAQRSQFFMIYKNKELITFYHEEKDRPEDFDTVIIKALMPASKLRTSGNTFPYGRELYLAWNWNRLDFASSQLFKHNIKINKMFLDLIVKILTVGGLEELYSKVDEDTLLYKLLLERLKERLENSDLDSLKEISLLEVSGVLKMFMGEEKPFYFTALGLEDFTSGKKALKRAKELLKGDCSYRDQPCESPWFHLFIWAVLQNRSDWAVFFWEKTEEPVLNALSACKMLKEMSKMEYKTETKRSMEKLSLKFEYLAHDVMGPCYQTNESNSLKMLNRESQVWGTNCLQMAMNAESRLFFNHDGLESLLSQVWWGDMKRDTPVWKFLLTFFSVLFSTNLIAFKDSDTDDSRWKKFWKKWFQFWSAPVSTFVSNAVMYIVFLFLFAYVLLVDFKPPPPTGPSISEYVLYFWVFTFLCEEIRQAFSVRLYWQDLWNWCDLFAIILFIVGLICRMFEWSYEFGRGVMCIDYMVFTIRLIHISTIHKGMGPKIIIVGKMMKDVLYFLFFLGVWLLAYGVANQALLYPYDPYPDRIFRRVFYRPYLYIFGDLNLEEIDVYGKEWEQNCTSNMTLVDGFTEPCRSEFNNWLVILLLVVFLLVTNILLINLLIAIFGNTFSKVDSDSKIYWRFQHYKLVMEYQSRPALAPPLIILSHIYLFCKHHCCGTNQSQPSTQNDPNTKPGPRVYCYGCGRSPIVGTRYECTECDDINLCPACQSKGTHKKHLLRSIEPSFQEWEREQKEKFLEAQSPERSNDSERMKQISDKVDNVLKQQTVHKVSRMLDQQTEIIDQKIQQMTDRVDRMEEQLTKQFTEQLNETKASLESKVEDCSKALSQILDTLAKAPWNKPSS